ncbi:MAG: pyridoxamine 5'-phosphate oxidase family protein [Patescibacteria group bacterium]
MDGKKLIQEYLKNARVMHLATSVNDKPWVCNVHFYADDENNLYWISTPTRRHSEEIAKNPNVAVTIKVHEDTPKEPYVIGLSLEGKAELLSEEETKEIGPKYIAKLGNIPTLAEDILSGKNPHKFYRLRPTNIVLFDTKSFPDNPRQEYKIGG